MKIWLYIGVLIGVPTLVAFCTHVLCVYRKNCAVRQKRKEKELREKTEAERARRAAEYLRSRDSSYWTPEQTAEYERRKQEKAQRIAETKARTTEMKETLKNDPILQQLDKLNNQYQAFNWDDKTCINMTYRGWIPGEWDAEQMQGIIDCAVNKRKRSWFDNLESNIRARDEAYALYQTQVERLRKQLTEPYLYQKERAFCAKILQRSSNTCIHIQHHEKQYTDHKGYTYSDISNRVPIVFTRNPKWHKAEDVISQENVLPNQAGVYIIRNTTRNKRYVGQSQNVLSRVRTHLRGAGNGDLYADYAHGDKISVSVVLLQDSEYDNLDDLERYYIAFYDAYNKGYNRNPGSKPRKGVISA